MVYILRFTKIPQTNLTVAVIYCECLRRPLSLYLLQVLGGSKILKTILKKINFKNELFRRKYTQEKAMHSSLLRFGQFKLKYITRTARYW